MSNAGGLLAWVIAHADHTFTAAFVGADARSRNPASQVHASHDDAARWVEAEAAAIGLSIEWISPPERVPLDRGAHLEADNQASKSGHRR
jgi:hypothetical protein